ncbi:glycyl-radical enzyme activating protein [Chloroflexota bacterium]
MRGEVRAEGIVVKIQRFSVQDGPGIRTTVFLKGCPLRCLWCSNPETQNTSVEVEYDRAKCLPQCYECVDVCDSGAIASDGDYITINNSQCTGCGKCTEVCYRRALVLIGQKMSVEDVVNEVESDKPFYEKSGGGVTLSGGEPLSQPEFARQIAEECKQRDISTALDTSGQIDWKVLEDVLEYIDLVLYDIKLLDSEEHKKFTGVSNQLILENARKVSQEDIPLILRVPVVPGINDSPENLRQLAEFANSLPHLLGVQLLPYHRIGVHKYPMLGRKCPLADLKQPTKDYMLRIRKLLESFGIESLIVS